MPNHQEELLLLLKDVYGALHDVAKDTWREFGLARPAALVMRQVSRRPGVTVSELSRITEMAKSNVSKAVESLWESGFISKDKDPNDQRLVLLHATPKAKEHFSKMWGETTRRLADIIGELPEGQLDEIIDALKALKEAIDKGAGS